MDYKFKLSDIVKYILLGAIFIALVAFSLLSYSGFRLIEINNQYIKIASDFSFLLTAIAISLSYLIGLMIHSFNELVISSYGKLRNRRTYFSTRNHDFSKGFKFNIQIFEFNIREIYSKVFSKVFAKALAYILELLFYKNTINYTCNSLNKYGKKTGVYDEDIPKWIVLSYNPDKMLLVLSEKIASRDGGDSKSEFLYLNEFVLGLRSTLIALISIISYRILADNSKYDELAIFIPIGILLWCFLSFFAKSFAIKYIKHIDTCIEAGGIDINELLHKKELPCAYILIRTTTSRDHLFFKKMVKSVVTQDYQNIKVIIQEDIDIKNSNKESRNTLQEFIDIKNSLTTDKNEYIKIVYCADKYGGAAGSSIAIREKFCDLASDTDIAIFLDDDDEFVSRNSVSSIMLKMVATDADLCMVAFGVTDALGHNIISNGSKNDYNNLLNKISFHNRTVKYESVDNMYHAASMGWTKCYKRSVLETYCQIVRRCDEIRKESNRSEFADLKSYEDFQIGRASCRERVCLYV